MIFYSYGFCYADNRYDSLIFKVRLNVNITDDFDNLNGGFNELIPHPRNRSDMLCSEEIRLKFDLLNVTLLGYLRTIFKNYYIKHVKIGISVLLTKPKDVDYELFIFKKYLGLMQHLLQEKEWRSGTLE